MFRALLNHISQNIFAAFLFFSNLMQAFECFAPLGLFAQPPQPLPTFAYKHTRLCFLQWLHVTLFACCVLHKAPCSNSYASSPNLCKEKP